MKEPRINEWLELADGTRLRVREALPNDLSALSDLYDQVYGGTYSLPEVSDRDLMRRVLNDPQHLWLAAEDQGELVGTVLFQIDSAQRLGKAAAGVVSPDHRGHKLMVAIVERGLKWLLEESRQCDLVYAVVRTFISPEVHHDLKSLGFVDLGVFPNVRKLSRNEIHGLKVCYTPAALAARRGPPHLTPQANRIYKIARDRLDLEPAMVEYREPLFNRGRSFDFQVDRGADVPEEYLGRKSRGELNFAFFPFHEPQLRFRTTDGSTQVYIHFQPKDGHASLLGLVTDHDDIRDVLEAVSLKGDALGFNYLELLIDADDPVTLWQAYQAGFLPCAYAPGLYLQKDGRRLDYVVTCRYFVPLHFSGLQLAEDIKPYMKAFIITRMNKLLEDVDRA